MKNTLYKQKNYKCKTKSKNIAYKTIGLKGKNQDLLLKQTLAHSPTTVLNILPNMSVLGLQTLQEMVFMQELGTWHLCQNGCMWSFDFLCMFSKLLMGYKVAILTPGQPA